MSQEEKFLQRKFLREKISQLTEREKKSASEKIVHSISEWLTNRKEKKIALFSSLLNEPYLFPLVKKFPEKNFLFPLVKKFPEKKILSFHQICSLNELKKGSFGILEPQPKIHRELTIEEIEIFFIPALGFSKKGERIGKGKGYYDRTLKKRGGKSLLIGVCFHCQLTEKLPTEPFDVKMDYLLTEKQRLTEINF